MFYRKCPQCEEILKYKTKYILNSQIKKNTKCRTCARIGKFCGTSHPLYGKQRPIEVKNKISKSNIGKHGHKHTECAKEKIRLSKIGKKFSDKHRKNLSDSHLGYSPTEKHRRNLRLAQINWVKTKKFNGNQFYPVYNKKACEIIEEYGKQNGYNFQHAENGGEFYIKELGYWVDGYDKEKNVVIEYYEKFHKKRRKKDVIRKNEIIKNLNCKFVELYEEVSRGR